VEAVTDLAGGFSFLAHRHAGYDDAQFRLPNVGLWAARRTVPLYAGPFNPVQAPTF